jgi:hypothetical protein
MPLVRVHNFSISLDGFGSGEPQSFESPFGHAGQKLHEWMFATRLMGEGGGVGVDHAFATQHDIGFGAEIMGAAKFGPPGWQDDPDWTGWWGPDPPFHTPTYVLTHRPRPPLEMEIWLVTRRHGPPTVAVARNHRAAVTDPRAAPKDGQTF